MKFSPNVISQSDHYLDEMHLPNKHELNNEYRYGFQGQEMDDEVKGKGNSVNYKYRMHDPRVGRFFAVDPLAKEYPHNGPYNFSENRVINAVELEGLEAEDAFVEGSVAETYSPHSLYHNAADGVTNVLAYVIEVLRSDASEGAAIRATFKTHGITVPPSITDAQLGANFQMRVRNGGDADGGMRIEPQEGNLAGATSLLLDIIDGVSVVPTKGGGVMAVKSSVVTTKAVTKTLKKINKAATALPSTTSSMKKGLVDVSNMTRADIAKSISKNFPSLKYAGGSPDGKFMQWKDANGNVRARIDPPDAKTSYDHLHIYDSKGNSLDIDLNVKPADSPDVHIKIKSED